MQSRRPITRVLRSPSVIAFAAAVGIVVITFIGFVAIGGGYGLIAMIDGHNPLALTPPTPAAESESRRRGDRIIAALEAHRANRARYPAALEKLVPGFLAAVEPPTVGDRRWRYRVKPDGSFSLSFFVGPSYESDWYENGNWYSDR